METFLSLLIQGALSLFGVAAQHELNREDWAAQNEYNETMYNKYNAPVARMEQLKNAGLSDSAIGQALSGSNGSSTMVSSAPIQPTNIMDAISGFGQLTNENQRVKNETDLKIANIDEIKQNIKKLAKETDRIEAEKEKINADTQLTEQEKKDLMNRIEVYEYSMENLKTASDTELRKITRETQKAYYDMRKALHENNVSAYDELAAKYKAGFLRKFHVPFDSDSKFVMQIIKDIFGMMNDGILPEFGIMNNDSLDDSVIEGSVEKGITRNS